MLRRVGAGSEAVLHPHGEALDADAAEAERVAHRVDGETGVVVVPDLRVVGVQFGPLGQRIAGADRPFAGVGVVQRAVLDLAVAGQRLQLAEGHLGADEPVAAVVFLAGGEAAQVLVAGRGGVEVDVAADQRVGVALDDVVDAGDLDRAEVVGGAAGQHVEAAVGVADSLRGFVVEIDAERAVGVDQVGGEQAVVAVVAAVGDAADGMDAVQAAFVALGVGRRRQDQGEAIEGRRDVGQRVGRAVVLGGHRGEVADRVVAERVVLAVDAVAQAVEVAGDDRAEAAGDADELVSGLVHAGADVGADPVLQVEQGLDAVAEVFCPLEADVALRAGALYRALRLARDDRAVVAAAVHPAHIDVAVDGDIALGQGARRSGGRDGQRDDFFGHGLSPGDLH